MKIIGYTDDGRGRKMSLVLPETPRKEVVLPESRSWNYTTEPGTNEWGQGGMGKVWCCYLKLESQKDSASAYNAA